MSTFKSVHDRSGQANAHGNLALAYQAIKNYDQAYAHFCLHHRLASELKDGPSEQVALLNLGNYFMVRHDYARAVEQFQEYVLRARQTADREAEARGAHLIGLCHHHRQDHEQAIEHFEQELALAKAGQDRAAIGRAYCYLGLSRFALGHLDQALECQKFYLIAAQGDAPSKLQAMEHIADILVRQGKCDEAMRLLQKHLTLAQSLEDAKYQANSFESLGQCQKKVENYEEAAVYFKQELLLRAQVKDILGEISALGELLFEIYGES